MNRAQLVSNTPNTIVNTIYSNIVADGGTADKVLLTNEYNDLHSTIKKGASLVVAGGAYKAGTVYGYNPQTSALIPFTFTRTGAVATRVNSNGLIETVAANVPRMDFDPVTKRFKGLLMEKGSTNLLQRSEEFDNASWTKFQTTVTANAAVSPDGNVTADKLVVSSSSGTDHITYQQSTIANGICTASIFFKAAEYRYVCLSISSNGDADRYFVFVDLQTGTNYATTTSGTVTNQSNSIQDFGNGWFKVTASMSCTNNARLTVNMCNTAATTIPGLIFTGDGVSGIYIWGAQLEASAYPTSYIPTQGSSVSRGAETCSASVGSWYNQSEGSMYANVIQNIGGNTQGGIAELWNTNTSKMSFRARQWLGDNAGSQWTLTYFTPTVFRKYAVCYKSNDIAAVIDGDSASIDTSATIPTVNTIYLGTTDAPISPIYFDGNIKNVSYFPTRLPNTDLQEITK